LSFGLNGVIGLDVELGRKSLRSDSIKCFLLVVFENETLVGDFSSVSVCLLPKTFRSFKPFAGVVGLVLCLFTTGVTHLLTGAEFGYELLFDIEFCALF
jgi:hypothetical protein